MRKLKCKIDSQILDMPIIFEPNLTDTSDHNGSRWGNEFTVIQNTVGEVLATGQTFGYLFRGVTVIILSTIGTLFNIFILCAIVPNRSLRNARYIFLIHLGAVGLATSVIEGTYSGVVLILGQGQWIGGPFICCTLGFLLSLLTVLTTWTITALSWDKYQTIASPLHHSNTTTKQRTTYCFLSFWLGAFLLSLPPVFGISEYNFHKSMGLCTITYTDTRGRWYSITYTCFVCVIPLLIMIYCYSHIFQIARTQRRRIAATMFRMVSLFQAPAVTPVQSTPVENKGSKTIGTILQYVGTFVFAYIPLFAVAFLEIVSGDYVNDILVATATVIFQASPLINGGIHGLKNKILRNSFYRYWSRRFRLMFYKDKRRGSVKSLSRKPSTTNLRTQSFRLKQSPSIAGLRRTQSYQVNIVKEEYLNTIQRNNSFNVPLQNGTAPDLTKLGEHTSSNGEAVRLTTGSVSEQSSTSC